MKAMVPRLAVPQWFALFLATAPAPALSQATGEVPRSLELPASTRAMALGNAYQMNAGHADALFYHPALLVDAGGFGLDLQRWDSRSTATTASAAMSWLGGGVGVGLMSLQFNAPSGGVLSVPGGQDHLFDLGPTPASERVAVVGYARQVIGIQVGLAGKLVEERVGTSRSATAAVDVGVAARLGRATVGLTFQNLGQDLTLGGRDIALPERLTLTGGGYGLQVGALDVGLTASTTLSDGEIMPAGGVEVGYWPISGRTFVARVGLQRVVEGAASPFTFGLAFWGDDLVLEWAFQDFGDLGRGSHRFGVRWK